MTCKELVIYQEKLYWIYKKVKTNQIKENHLQDIKEFWGCDIIIRNLQNNSDTLLFLREIPDLEIIE